ISLFPEINNEWINTELEEKFENLSNFRDVVNRALEKKRKDKFIGNSLEAKITIYCKNKQTKEFLENLDINLSEYFIVSGFNIKDYTPETTIEEEDDNIAVTVTKADGEKCVRCWIFSETVGTFSEHPTICKKCYDTLKGDK
ncbi:isoleucine--tRNA ligase, partial [candidate division WOR-3 bacterium]|nr:isoleucine--tRNA ligase [candidate division WOR-3 bacterium]